MNMRAKVDTRPVVVCYLQTAGGLPAVGLGTAVNVAGYTGLSSIGGLSGEVQEIGDGLYGYTPSAGELAQVGLYAFTFTAQVNGAADGHGRVLVEVGRDDPHAGLAQILAAALAAG